MEKIESIYNSIIKLTTVSIFKGFCFIINTHKPTNKSIYVVPKRKKIGQTKTTLTEYEV